MDKKVMRKWAQLRDDAYEQAKLLGLSPQDIAKKVGTSASNVTNTIRRGSHTSPFSGPIDALLRETVAEYDSQLNDLFESTGDPHTEIGNLLMAQGRLLRAASNSIEYKTEIVDVVIQQLESFRRNYARLAAKDSGES